MSLHLNELGLPQGYDLDAAWEVAPRALSERLRRGEDVKLIDCRTQQEREIALIAGSIHAPLHELSDQLEQLRAFEEDPIVVFCHHGVRSRQVVSILREAGFEDVYSMAGGIDLWAHAVDESIPTY